MGKWKAASIILISFFLFQPVFSQSSGNPRYIEICKRGNHDTLIHYSQKWMDMPDNSSKAKGWFVFAYSYYNKGQMDSTIHYLQTAREYAKNQSPELQAEILNLMSISASRAHKYALTEQFFHELLQVTRAAGDSLRMASAYGTMGITMKNQHKFEEAIEYYTKAAEIYLALKHRLIVNQYSNIAIAYSFLGHNDLALDWFHKAYRESLQHEEAELKHRASGNLGNMFKKMGELDSSLFYVKSALQYTDIPLYRSLDYQRIAEIFMKMAKMDSASFYIEKAKEIAKNIDIPLRKIELLSIESQIALALNNYDTALSIADSALMLSNKYALPDKILKFTMLKTDVYKQMQDYDKALEALERYNFLKDSLIRTEDKEKIQKVIAEYELQEKEAEITTAFTRYRAERRRTIIIACLLAASFVALLILALKYKKKQKNTMSPVQEEMTFLLKSGQVVKCNELLYVKADGNYLEYHLETGKTPLLERKRLKDTIDILGEHGFVQVHRSYLVNTSKIKAIQGYVITLESGVEIPFSRTFKQFLRKNGPPLFH